MAEPGKGGKGRGRRRDGGGGFDDMDRGGPRGPPPTYQNGGYAPPPEAAGFRQNQGGAGGGPWKPNLQNSRTEPPGPPGSRADQDLSWRGGDARVNGHAQRDLGEPNQGFGRGGPAPQRNGAGPGVGQNGWRGDRGQFDDGGARHGDWRDGPKPGRQDFGGGKGPQQPDFGRSGPPGGKGYQQDFDRGGPPGGRGYQQDFDRSGPPGGKGYQQDFDRNGPPGSKGYPSGFDRSPMANGKGGPPPGRGPGDGFDRGPPGGKKGPAAGKGYPDEFDSYGDRNGYGGGKGGKAFADEWGRGGGDGKGRPAFGGKGGPPGPPQDPPGPRPGFDGKGGKSRFDEPDWRGGGGKGAPGKGQHDEMDWGRGGDRKGGKGPPEDDRGGKKGGKGPFEDDRSFGRKGGKGPGQDDDFGYGGGKKGGKGPPQADDYGYGGKKGGKGPFEDDRSFGRKGGKGPAQDDDFGYGGGKRGGKGPAEDDRGGGGRKGGKAPQEDERSRGDGKGASGGKGSQRRGGGGGYDANDDGEAEGGRRGRRGGGQGGGEPKAPHGGKGSHGGPAEEPASKRSKGQGGRQDAAAADPAPAGRSGGGGGGGGGTGAVSAKHVSSVRFGSLDVSQPLKTALAKGFGYEFMTEVQAATIGPMLAGKDVVARAKTGTGKTLAFLVPMVERLHQHPGGVGGLISALVLSPTRELAQQISDEGKVLLNYHKSLGIACFYGGTNIGGDQRTLAKQSIDILVATPGRMQDHLDNTNGFRKRLEHLKLLVLDEADQLLDMGFRDAILKILRALPPAAQRQGALFSATFPAAVGEISKLALRPNHELLNTVKADEEVTPDQIDQCVSITDLEGMTELLWQAVNFEIKRLPKQHKIMVFFTTARLTQLYSMLFGQAGVQVLEIHSRKSQAHRTKCTETFRNSQSGIIFSSDVCARGLDYPNVTTVIQVGIPSSRDQYIHRLGRTGRAGKSGRCILLLHDFERFFLKQLSDLPVKQVTAAGEFSGTPAAPDTLWEPKDWKSAGQAYQAWLGYYNSVKGLGWPKDQLVREATRFAASIGAVGSDGLPPPILKKTVGMMGLKGVPGLNIVSQLPYND